VRGTTLITLLAGCGGGGPLPDAFVPSCEPLPGEPALGLVEIAHGFDMPVGVVGAPGEPRRLFVLEKGGRIRVIDDGVVLSEPFLTVEGPDLSGLDDERGLLGLAFDPGYATNRRFYVFYSDADSDTVVERWLVSAGDPDRAEPDSAEPVLFVDDFAGNHNGGTLAFGPDGYLHVGIGDGGGANDPMDYGQDTRVPFGKILRLDVASLPYSIPADNPGLEFAEIWSYGWRNPWRFSFDRATGDLYVGDVGQDAWEEIDVEPAADPGGRNYGWNDMEGAHCFEPSSGCVQAGRVAPVYEWNHQDGRTAVGGHVYRGCSMPGHHGKYFFADYVAGWVRSFRWDGAGGYTELEEWPALGGADIVSFGEDADGELYLVRQDTGQIMRVVGR
jgi:glucose/arabinose dehydrogenase